jgi:bla regulator protein BlaR1
VNPAYLSPLANHLWRSTLFAAIAGLLTLALRNNHARLRHWVWLAASCKFLIPCSLLIGLGGHVRWRTAPETTQSNLIVAMGQVSQPFTDPAFSLPLLPAAPPAGSPISSVLLGTWLCGFLGIASAWWVRWRRIRVTVRAGSSISLGLPIRAMSSPALIEPGVFGIFRPVLLLPEGIVDRLTAAQLKGVIAHELCHIRYRDNLVAALQMSIEKVFWFHPLVWWIGRRMVEERERACDEEVLRLGCEARVYAEGILTICKLYTESRLVCVSGVSGSNLKKRIETIMHPRPSVSLNFMRKTALAFAGMAALAALIVIGMMNAPVIEAQSPAATRFDVASIKPTSQQGRDIQGLGDVEMLPGGYLRAEKIQLSYFVQNAYGVKPFQISGGPAWINSAHYDIDAKANGNPNPSQMRLMMQALLEERFKLKVHHETRQLPVYELVVAKGGAKLPEPREGSCVAPDPNGSSPPPAPGQLFDCGRVLMMMSPAGAQMRGGKVTVADLVRTLSNVLGQTVVDRTEVQRTFDVHLEFTPDETLGGLPAPPPVASPSTDLHGNLFAAIQEQLGLKLESAKGPVDILVIDSVERPSGN